MGKKKINKTTPQEDITYRCPQTQCQFHSAGCRECEECHIEPHVIKYGCERCWRCANVPNELRFSDDKAKKENELLALKQMKEAIEAMIHELEAKQKPKQEQPPVEITCEH